MARGIHHDRQPRPRGRSRRRIAVASWRAPADGLVQGFLDVDVTRAESWCAARGVTLTHLVGCGVGRALAVCPDARSRVVAGRVVERSAADVSFTVTVGLGEDLRAVCVRDADAKSPQQVAAELLGGARRILRGDDVQAGRAVAIADRLPRVLVRPALALAGFLANGVGVRLPFARVEPHAFGSAIITAVDVLGLQRGLAPLVPLARASTVVCVGAPQGRVLPEGTRRILELGLTFDHRLVDGAQIAAFTRELRAVVEQPWVQWGPVDRLRPVRLAPAPGTAATGGPAAAPALEGPARAV